jgi:hypothetical protein
MIPRWQVTALLLTLVVASGFVEFHIRLFPEYAYTTYIPGVIDGTYGAPATYRVLVPFGNTWLSHVTGLSPAAIWHATRLAWFFAAYLAVLIYLRSWFNERVALAGVCAVAAALPLTYTNSWAHADSIPELALFTLGCAAVVRGWDAVFAIALVAAAFNRETAGFLIPVYFLARPLTLRNTAKSAGFAALFLMIFIGLRLWRGIEHYDYWQLGRNLEFLKLLPPPYDIYKRAYAWFVVALAGPAAAIIAAGWKQIPWNARRLVWATAPFLLTSVTISSIIETRIFIPLIPLLLPAALWALMPPQNDRTASS